MSVEQILWIVVLLLFAGQGYVYGFMAGYRSATKAHLRIVGKVFEEQKHD